MKKEFKKLLESEHGALKISEIAVLERTQHDYFENEIDKLEIIFVNPTGRVSFYTGEIKSRDTEGIAREIAEHTRKFAEKWTEEETTKILSGKMDFRFWEIG
jgi:hypothetical protein